MAEFGSIGSEVERVIGHEMPDWRAGAQPQ